jgi:hypothetical protein
MNYALKMIHAAAAMTRMWNTPHHHTQWIGSLCRTMLGGVVLLGLMLIGVRTLRAQETETPQDAPVEKKKTVRKAAKSAAASSEDIEALINEMAKKLKETKEREQTERDEKKKVLQEKLQKLNAEMQSLQQDLRQSELNAGEAVPDSRPSVAPMATPTGGSAPLNARPRSTLQPNGAMPSGMGQPPNGTATSRMGKNGLIPVSPNVQTRTVPAQPMPAQSIAMPADGFMSPNSGNFSTNGQPAPVNTNPIGTSASPTTGNDRYRPRDGQSAAGYAVPNSDPNHLQPKPPRTANMGEPSAVQSVASQPLASQSYQMLNAATHGEWMSLSQDKLVTYPAFAEGKNVGMFRNGFGMTNIDGSAYYAVNFAPELMYGNFALGLDATIRLDNNGNLRQEDWQNFDAVLRSLRYVRYSSDLKGLFGETEATNESKVFVRLGQLENVTLGTGSIVNNYRNTISFDARKVGAELKVMTNEWQLDAFTSNLTAAEVMGGRFEFKEKSQNGFLLKELRIGATGAIDVAPQARLFQTALVQRVPTGFQAASAGFAESGAVRSGVIGVVGADVSASLVQSSLYDVSAQVEYGRMIQNAYSERVGSGGALALLASAKSPDQKTEASVIVKHFVAENGYAPVYFNGFYEAERYQVVGQTAGGQALVQTKANAAAFGQGLSRYFIGGRFSYKDKTGAVAGDGKAVVQELWIEGNYTNVYSGGTDAALYVGVGMSEVIPSVSGYLRLNKRFTGVGSFWGFDDKTFIRAEVTLRLMERVILGTSYDWTFAPVYGSDNRTVIDFIPQRRIDPRVNFSFAF